MESEAPQVSPSFFQKNAKLILLIAVFLVIGIAVMLVVIYKLNSAQQSVVSNPTTSNTNSTDNTTTSKDTNNTATTPTPGANPIVQTNVLDIHNLPLGDGKTSTSAKVDYVYSCQLNFNGGGAEHDGGWIHGSTWDLTEKLSVEGEVTWPNAQFTITTSGNNRVITGNGLPIDTETGTFPIQTSDPAYQIDRNPNSIKNQNISINLPMNPTFAAKVTCVPMGMIGIALNGVAIFNALDAAGRDAVAHEVQDVCGGHPERSGEYHYHGPSSCLPNQTENNTLIGYALDGFGIYSIYNAAGKEMTNADLDECHGTTSEVMWDGKLVNMYHYVLTQEYPYTIGCFKGTRT